MGVRAPFRSRGAILLVVVLMVVGGVAQLSAAGIARASTLPSLSVNSPTVTESGLVSVKLTLSKPSSQTITGSSSDTTAVAFEKNATRRN